jgi:hypothetical protein
MDSSFVNVLMLEGKVPFSLFTRRNNTCSFDSCPIDDGMLPLTLVHEICRLVREVRPPILVGIVPFKEGDWKKYKFCSFDSCPMVVGIDPDNEYI